MSTKTTVKTKPKLPRVSKINVWLSHFINSSNPKTYLNRTEAARAAGYKADNIDSLMSVGNQNFRKCSDKISQWLDEDGFSDAVLRIKLQNLMSAKETKFQNMKGAVSESTLPGNVSVLATTGVIERDEDGGTEYGTGDTLLAIETEALEIQRRSLDMAFKIKGTYAPEKHEHTLKDHEEKLEAAMAQKSKILGTITHAISST